MPNIVSQTVDETGISITTTNGKTYTLTPQKILSQMIGVLGTSAQKKAVVMNWVGSDIQDKVGEDMIYAGNVTVDFDPITGIPNNLVITG